MTWAPDYVTTAEYKAWARIDDTVDDVQIGLAITTASRAIDKTCGRQFGSVSAPSARYLTPRYNRLAGHWMVRTDDYATQTGMTVSVDGVLTTDYVPWVRHAVDHGMVWVGFTLGATVSPTGQDDTVIATATWGWSSVPSAVKLACLLQTSRFLARRDSPYGIAGSPSEGSEVRLLSTVDPDVRVSLDRYTRKWAVR